MIIRYFRNTLSSQKSVKGTDKDYKSGKEQ